MEGATTIAERPAIAEQPKPTKVTAQEILTKFTGDKVTQVEEVETKLPLPSQARRHLIRDVLSKIEGIQEVFHGDLKTVELNPPEEHKDLVPSIRIRQFIPSEGGESWIAVTIKETPEDAKDLEVEGIKKRLETEVIIKDAQTLEQVVGRLHDQVSAQAHIPLTAYLEPIKRRTAYEGPNGTHFAIDRLRSKKGRRRLSNPLAIEIEADSKEALQAGVQKVRQKLLPMSHLSMRKLVGKSGKPFKLIPFSSAPEANK